VFIGGGRASNGISSTTNGSVSVDLSNSTVDAKSLGLKGAQAIGTTGTDIGTGSASTTVAQILADATNTGSEATGGFTNFYFQGPGFAGANKVTVSVNLAGVTDTATLATAVNAAIQAAGNGTSQAATAFKNAGITGAINTDAAGKKQLTFNSSNAAFQAAAGDRVANALLGNFSSGTTGRDLTNTVTSANVGTLATALAQNVIIRIQGSGLAAPVDIQINSNPTTANALTSLSSQVANNAALQAAGITVSVPAAAGSPITFTSKRGESFSVAALGDVANQLGLGTFRNNTTTGTAFEYTTLTAGTAYAAAAKTDALEFSIAGGTAQAITVGVLAADTIQQATDKLNTAILGNATLTAAGLVASNAGGFLVVTSSNGTAFRLNSTAATASAVLGFGGSGTAGSATLTATATDTANNVHFDAGGESSSGPYAFTSIKNGQDAQTLTFAARDSSGAEKTTQVVLQNNATARNARSIDEAIAAINTQLQQSNDPTLQKITAIKFYDTAATSEKIKFVSSLSNFNVSLGAAGTGSAVGIGAAADQGSVHASAVTNGGSTADISSQDVAQSAVTALSNAVASLGTAQAVVGRGQNQFNYAINLAQSQLSNLAAAESRIRDADLASEAANLTKSQILLQAGIAALAQANSAPQQVLSLLRG